MQILLIQTKYQVLNQILNYFHKNKYQNKQNKLKKFIQIDLLKHKYISKKIKYSQIIILSYKDNPKLKKNYKQ